MSQLAALLAPDAREDKLPRWAREKLDRLRDSAQIAAREVEYADRRAEEARLATRPEESDAVLVAASDEVPIGLGKEPRVRFRPNAPDSRYIDVWLEHDVIWVRGPWELAIHPYSGNVAKLTSR
ncbi:hypothetical protein V1227_18705 [Lentzea sp. DG1S-22]|uniref:DUF7239 family protein n=1 Tax=Lentzea sp. DG1S-22 TaxID=3108822 RepID=UPI002E7653D1|nr:hypothetical protein [Lentzea sp. DG1S-22]WVH84686.1 hypothetical protein V1227_18705 [Lentzea sp. DG1S-22]